ncbi:unnamed protein product [Lactuca virosa]|uniref:GRF-type domain-containing protein n=1 Tax=Lactuca virosa TaxID=75947 RepID=A0AAU9PSP4_9ASTR|nr:unnamed protein product [Lactuca virosa]
MATSSSNSATSRITKLVKCYCGDVCYVAVSRTSDNPGRKFWGCPNFKESSRCRFFKWVDECGNKSIQQEDELMGLMKIVAELMGLMKIVAGLLMFNAIMLVIVVLKM